MELKINELCKAYPNGVKAIDNVSLKIGAGMFGLLGPNGAGKSSLMRTIATLQAPDSGTIFFNDIDVIKNQQELRQQLGYLPQDFGVYPKVSAVKLLDYFAILKGISSKKNRQAIVEEVLHLTNLYDVKKKHVSSFSGGMRQRFGIAQLLLNRPKLIIVDEPTAGLDPEERNRFLNVLRDIGSDNIVIFSTHLVDDVKELCTHMAILNQGKICMEDRPVQAIEKLKNKVWSRQVSKPEVAQLEAQYQVLSSSYNEDHSLKIKVLADVQPALEWQPEVPNLEDVYFSILKYQGHV